MKCANGREKLATTEQRFHAASPRPYITTNSHITPLPDELDLGESLGFPSSKRPQTPALPRKVDRHEPDKNRIDTERRNLIVGMGLLLFLVVGLTLFTIVMVRHFSPRPEAPEQPTVSQAVAAPMERQAPSTTTTKEPLIPPAKAEKRPSEPPKWYYTVSGQGAVLEALAVSPQSAREAITREHPLVPGGIVAWFERESAAHYLASAVEQTVKGGRSPRDLTRSSWREDVLKGQLLTGRQDRGEWDHAMLDVRCLVAWSRYLEKPGRHRDALGPIFQGLAALQNDLALYTPWVGHEKPPQALLDYVRVATVQLTILDTVQLTNLDEVGSNSGFFPLPPLPYLPRFSTKDSIEQPSTDLEKKLAETSPPKVEPPPQPKPKQSYFLVTAQGRVLNEEAPDPESAKEAIAKSGARTGGVLAWFLDEEQARSFAEVVDALSRGRLRPQCFLPPENRDNSSHPRCNCSPSRASLWWGSTRCFTYTPERSTLLNNRPEWESALLSRPAELI